MISSQRMILKSIGNAVANGPSSSFVPHFRQKSVSASMRQGPEASATASAVIDALNFPAWFLEHSSKLSSTSTKSTTAPFTSMQDLVHRIPSILQERKEKNIEPGSWNDPVINHFRQIRLDSREWERYAFSDASKPYTRNLIATDNKTYTLLLLCWNPQHESPIHDHPCDGCWVRVLKGKIRECRYNADLECISDQVYKEDEVSLMTDNMGYHKIGNPTQDEVAMSLHLYAPPIQQCRTWRLPEEKENASIAKSTHYSEYGRLSCSYDP